MVTTSTITEYYIHRRHSSNLNIKNPNLSNTILLVINITEWTQENKITINPDKSQYFTRKLAQPTVMTRVNSPQTIKYLGIKLDMDATPSTNSNQS